MKTLIIFPSVIQRSVAYVHVDTGEVWGPLYPMSLRDFPSRDWTYYPPAKIALASGENFDSRVKAIAAQYITETPELNAGEHYPRMWRTGRDVERYGDPILRVEETRFLGSFVNSVEQIERLFESLTAIFRTVHPATDNLDAYGAAIRDLIILACTEVEAQWKGVLEANKCKPSGTFYKTTDYVKLASAMKLKEYQVALIRYPQISAITPFSTWKGNSPTKSLPWYDAYNEVKHDREANFTKASLRHAIESVAACVVMLAAQFGMEALRRHQLRNVFEFRSRPMWPPKEWYYQPIPGKQWTEVVYQF